MGSWNSISMEIIYQVLGWISIICWALASYPQVILNFRRKSVVGLSFDYVMLNCTKQSSYLIYNATLFFSSTVQRQYFDKYGYDQMIPVALSDVFFPFHSILLISVVSVQIVFFDVSAWQPESLEDIHCYLCCSMVLRSSLLFYGSANPFMALARLHIQAFLNFTRKSTVGFSIGNIVLDFTGGVGTLAQMSVQSIDQGSWVNFFGNIGKPLLALVSIGFDLIFFYQHFVLYHIKASRVSFQRDPESTEPLIKDSDHLQGIATTS
ncbi:cystinosin homolog isoform X4 [Benincasa hispida]|uniref:cystinosin homolog isoform X4 n=1 Tax=Benincasa hispida TaxID=102211 RepID=UPI001900F257|nr:cystinosin homolog isoform X4 [Benincasa hispida]